MKRLILTSMLAAVGLFAAPVINSSASGSAAQKRAASTTTQTTKKHKKSTKGATKTQANAPKSNPAPSK